MKPEGAPSEPPTEHAHNVGPDRELRPGETPLTGSRDSATLAPALARDSHFDPRTLAEALLFEAERSADPIPLIAAARALLATLDSRERPTIGRGASAG